MNDYQELIDGFRPEETNVLQRKKYEFTGETKEFCGVTLKQIRALVTIAGVVTAGDCGGWIESEKNLAQVYGDAWVYGDAYVSGNALVYDNARVSGNAWVYGNARVYGDSRVYGSAQVYGNAQVYGDAWVYGNNSLFWASKVGTENGTLTVFNSKGGTLTAVRGCFIGSCEEFLAKSKRVHDEKTHREYCLLIEVAKSRVICKAD